MDAETIRTVMREQEAGRETKECKMSTIQAIPLPLSIRDGGELNGELLNLNRVCLALAESSMRIELLPQIVIEEMNAAVLDDSKARGEPDPGVWWSTGRDREVLDDSKARGEPDPEDDKLTRERGEREEMIRGCGELLWPSDPIRHNKILVRAHVREMLRRVRGVSEVPTPLPTYAELLGDRLEPVQEGQKLSVSDTHLVMALLDAAVGRVAALSDLDIDVPHMLRTIRASFNPPRGMIPEIAAAELQKQDRLRIPSRVYQNGVRFVSRIAVAETVWQIQKLAADLAAYADSLRERLNRGLLTRSQYDAAWNVFSQIATAADGTVSLTEPEFWFPPAGTWSDSLEEMDPPSPEPGTRAPRLTRYAP